MFNANFSSISAVAWRYRQHFLKLLLWGHRGRDCMVVGFTSLNPAHGEVYLTQHYVLKFACDRSVIFAGFLH